MWSLFFFFFKSHTIKNISKRLVCSSTSRPAVLLRNIKTKEGRTKKMNSYRTFPFSPSVCLFHLHNNRRGSVKAPWRHQHKLTMEVGVRGWRGWGGGTVCECVTGEAIWNVMLHFYIFPKFLRLGQQLVWFRSLITCEIENGENLISS